MADRIADVPSDLRQLRSCLFCSLVKTWEQFEQEGCENCDEYLHLRQNKQRVLECTSANFEGVVSMMDPDSSWVARWQRINGSSKYVKGVYAISVNGRLPSYAVEELKEQGLRYIPRQRTT